MRSTKTISCALEPRAINKKTWYAVVFRYYSKIIRDTCSDMTSITATTKGLGPIYAEPNQIDNSHYGLILKLGKEMLINHHS